MITIENLSFRYQAGSPKILDGISLKIAEGERVLIAGKNGAGKTTLSKIIAGLIPRVEHGFLEGTYGYRNRPVSEYPPAEIIREIAVLFQDFEAQIVSTRVREELVFYPMNTGVPYFNALENARELSRVFKAETLFEREIDSLSGGEKQKTALLSLLSASPKMLILDEPFTDMDPASQELILDFIRHGGYAGGIIVLDQSLDYHTFFDRIILIGNGKILFDGKHDVIADRALLSAAGLGTSGIYKAVDCGYLAEPEAIIGHIRNHHVFDETAHEKIVSSPGISAENIVEVSSLSFKYRGSASFALKHIDLKLQKGDFITVLGANGSGKTTLMKLIAGILDVGKGDIRYQGRNTKKYPVAGKVGYVYQNPDNQIFAETVFDETAFILRMRGMAEAQIQEKVDAILTSMGLFDRKQADPFSLPKGDRQKVACAAILAGEPDLIILDEPTTGLDHPSLKALMEIVATLNKNGKTLIIITHSMETAANFGNKILALSQGEIFYYGDKRKFFDDLRLMAMGNVRRTEIMDLSLMLNGKLLLNENEFEMCWKKR
jgi:energy-coupling factor transport system ATP-binding protein